MLVYVLFAPVKFIRVNVECVMTSCAILGRYVCVYTVHCINSHLAAATAPSHSNTVSHTQIISKMRLNTLSFTTYSICHCIGQITNLIAAHFVLFFWAAKSNQRLVIMHLKRFYNCQKHL